MKQPNIAEITLRRRRDLIAKYLNDWQAPKTASIEHYLTTGKINGTMMLAVEELLYEFYNVERKIAADDLQSKIENRIKELYAADSEFCVDRWDMTKHPGVRALARESSNQVTFARQELQRLLKKSGAAINEKLFYIQNANAGHLGNSFLWWGLNRSGYTNDLNAAHKFTEAEAKEICTGNPDKNKAWPCE